MESLGIRRDLLSRLLSRRDDRTDSRMTVPRAFALIGVLGILIAGSLRMAGGRESASAVPVGGHNAIVLAELFTSEGCSSCPPADEILSRLVQQQPVTGVTVLGLSEHVDYWNRLGWVDPFSSASFSKRQSEYAARVFRSRDVFTPQLVIDGSQEEVGSDAKGVYRKIAQAAQVPKAVVNVVAGLPSATTALQIRIKVDVPPDIIVREASDVVIAIAEDNLASDVRHGENGGKLLKHSCVVRRLLTAGTLMPQTRGWSGTTSVAIAPEWKSADLKVIGFLQEQQSRRIMGAGWSNVGSQATTQ
jgi:hypothetical protein